MHGSIVREAGCVFGHYLPPTFPTDTQKWNGSLGSADLSSQGIWTETGLINHCLDRPHITFWKAPNVGKPRSHFLQWGRGWPSSKAVSTSLYFDTGFAQEQCGKWHQLKSYQIINKISARHFTPILSSIISFNRLCILLLRFLKVSSTVKVMKEENAADGCKLYLPHFWWDGA